MVSRIKQLLDWQQLSSTQFADRIGVGRPVVSHILSERNKPSLEVVQRVIAAFPEVSLAWLLSGSGPMLAAEADVTSPPPAVPAPTNSDAVPAAAAPAPIAPAPLPIDSDKTVSSELPAQASIAASLGSAVPPVGPVAGPAVPTAEATLPPAIPTPARFRAARPAVQAATAPIPPVAAPSPVAAPLPEAPASGLGGGPASGSAAAKPHGPTAPLATPAATAVPLPEAPAISTTATPSPAATDAAILAHSLAESGKAIRRIVIFYRDGSFADYQPE